MLASVYFKTVFNFSHKIFPNHPRDCVIIIVLISLYLLVKDMIIFHMTSFCNILRDFDSLMICGREETFVGSFSRFSLKAFEYHYTHPQLN